MNANKSFQISAAVHGFHVFQKTWDPVTNEMLKCAHESGNKYDPFSIKTCQIENGSKTVGHLPKEISRATKLLLDRGATISLKLSSDHYRRSPLLYPLHRDCNYGRNCEKPHGSRSIQRDS